MAANPRSAQRSNVVYNYDGFAGPDQAEAAVAALREAGVPATVTPTDTGSVVRVKGRFRRRAEALISPFQTDP
jgi:hypothetical protein